MEGSTLIFTCKGDSNIPQYYLLLKDGLNMTSINSNFTIEVVNRTDAGIYRCMNYNQLGQVLSKTLRLVVNCKSCSGPPLSWNSIHSSISQIQIEADRPKFSLN